VTPELRFRVIATALATLGGTLAAIAFYAARDPLVARVAGTSRGVPALVVLLAFTAIAIIVVVHYGRRSAQLGVAYHELHRATLQRERSEAALRESERFVRATLDSMDAMIAVLDADGVVMAVNRAWRRCMDDLVARGGACDVGANYVALCEAVDDDGGPVAHRVAAGIREVMAGARDGFALESHAPGDERRLLTHVTRFPGHGPLRLVVLHHHVTIAEPRHDAAPQPEEPALPPAEDTPPVAPEPEPPSEYRFRTFAETVPVGIFLAEPDGRITYANTAWHAMIGLATGPDVGMAWVDAVHPDDRDRVLATWRVLPAEPDAFAEFRVRTPAGAIRWMHVLAKPLAGGVVGAMLDVTDRRAIEERARGLNADLAGRLEVATRERERFLSLSHAFLYVANATHLTTVNRAFADALGYSADELLARPHLELVHPDDRDATRSRLESLGAGDPVVRFENRHRHRDGSWRTIAWTAVRESPEVVHAAGGDVSDRERARHDLERAAAELHELYDDAPCGYHTLDADGVVVAANRTARDLLGYADDELVGRRRFAELLTDRSARQFAPAFDRSTEHGRMAGLELEVVRRDGSILPILASAATIRDADGRFAGCRVSMLDLTDRRRAAERIAMLSDELAVRAGELEKANREIESFSRSVSHDLREPLRAIDDLARILHDERGEELGSGGKRHLEGIRTRAGRMAELIDGLLDLSRIGRRPLAPEHVDMTGLAEAVVEDVRRVEPEREVTIDVGALAPAVGDAAQLRRVLANLIANAVKYTGKVDHPCIDVGSVDHEGTPVYYVRDNGAGFDMRHADKLFHVFERLHAPEEFEGTGVGLAVVQRLVERHGGRVWAEGRVGEGATFFFTLGDRPGAEDDAAPSA
jgi:PAS domain S-box-containing protein